MNALVLLGGIVFIILSGCTQEGIILTNPNQPTSDTPDRGHFIFEKWAEQHAQTLEETKLFFEQTYGMKNEQEIFAALPAVPEDMDEWDKGWSANDINGLANVPENVYVQPEFHPTFNENGLKPWMNTTPNPPATFGIMSAPADQEVAIQQEETAFETILFVGSAWGATYYQGVGLTYTLEPDAPHTIEISPRNVLAGPTFPRFDEEWMHRITIKGTIHPEAGVKEYVLRIYPTQPHPDYEQQWYATHSPYLRVDTTYTNPEGLATLTFHVQEE